MVFVFLFLFIFPFGALFRPVRISKIFAFLPWLWALSSDIGAGPVWCTLLFGNLKGRRHLRCKKDLLFAVLCVRYVALRSGSVSQTTMLLRLSRPYSYDPRPISKKAKKIRYPNQSSCQTKRKDKIEMRKWTYMDMTHFITFQTIGSVRTLPELFANGWCLFCYAAGAGCCSYCSSNCSRMLRIAAYRSFFKSSMPTGLWFKMTL